MTRHSFEHWLTTRASRRAVLGGALATAAAVSLPGRTTRVLGQGTPEAVPLSTPRFGENPFTLGVASGDPLPTSVVLWTRLAPEPLGGGGMDPVPYTVRWEVATDDAFDAVVQSGVVMASPTLAHSVHVDVDGLEPGSECFYRFMVGDEVSPTGRTKTAPAMSYHVDAFRFGFASCGHWETGYFVGYRGMAEERFDLITHLGDYIYEGGARGADDPNPRRHNSPEIYSLADYRDRHALYKSDPDLQAAHASAPWAVTWDDHEVENNWASDISQDNDPVQQFLTRRADAFQAYYEHMPLRPSSMPVGPDMHLYRRLRFGNLAEIQILDTRQYRSNQPCGDGQQARCPAALDPNQTMTGPDQERWLLAGLDASNTTWNVIAQQTMMAQLTIQLPGDEPTFNMDQWDGYPAARNRILQHLSSRGIANPVVITGDIHSSWVNDLTLDFDDPDAPVVATELVGTSISSPFLSETGDPTPEEARQIDQARVLLGLINSHVKFFNGTRRGYVANHLTPDRWTAIYQACDSVLDPEARVAPQTAWVVEAGQAGADSL